MLAVKMVFVRLFCGGQKTNLGKGRCPQAQWLRVYQLHRRNV